MKKIATIKGINIQIGAETTGLQKALGDVNSKAKGLQSELRQVDKLLKLDPKNTELVAQKQNILKEAVANTKEKLDGLKQAQSQVNEQFAKGEISEEQHRAFQREISKTKQELDGLETKLKEVDKSSRGWADSLEITGKKLQDVGNKISDVGKNLSMKVTAPIVAAGTAAFLTAADLEDTMGATDQIFGKAAGGMKKWADGLPSYYGIAEGEALEYGNMMGSMLKNIGGLTEDEASKQAQTLIMLAGDLTAMYGGTTADAVQALTGALKGNNTMLDNYGMAANDAMIKTKAMEMGLYDGKGEMSLAAKQAATLALIMEQSGAATGQAGREAGGASGTLRAMATEAKNLAGDIGKILLPIITPLLEKIKGLVTGFGEMSPTAQKVIVAIALIAAAIGPILIVVGSLITAVGTIAKALSGMGGVLTFLTGPIGLVILAITALAAIALLVYKNWEPISGFFINLWGTIKTVFNEALEFIKLVIDTFKTAAEEKFNAFKTAVEIVWDAIKTVIIDPITLAFTTIGELIGTGISTIQTNFDTFKTNVQTAWDAIRTYIIDPISSAFKSALEFIDTGVSNILTAFNAFKTNVETVWGAIKTAIIDPIASAIKTVKDWFDNLSLPEIKIPSIKLPHFNITGKWDLVPPGISVPKIGVSWYDKGGVFTQPSIIGIAERRPEFVGALSDLKGIIRAELNRNTNNTTVRPITITGNTFVIREEADINKIARQLSRRMKLNTVGMG